MNLARNFTLAELTTTNHRAYLDANREAAMDPEVLVRLTAIAGVLQQVRDHFGKPVRLNSGLRFPPLNAAIGGSKSSQHKRGEAVDFTVDDVELEVVWEWIWKKARFGFGQLILEGVTAGKPTWIHLSLGAPWRPASRCGQVMTWSQAEGYHLVDQVNR